MISCVETLPWRRYEHEYVHMFVREHVVTVCTMKRYCYIQSTELQWKVFYYLNVLLLAISSLFLFIFNTFLYINTFCFNKK